MPMRDRTGPFGEGPLTGRGLGPCGRGMAFGRGFAGRGFGRGLGRGMGFRRMANVPAYEPVELSKEQKAKILEAEKAEIEAELKEVQKEIDALK